MLAVALATVLLHPPAARAQCNEACIQFISPSGPGWGCVVDNSSGAACYARSTKCYIKLCMNAMVTDPSGRTLAMADICGGNVAVRSLARASKPRSAAKLRQQRGTATIAVAPKARAPSAG
jgi:hypothetical protein